jgi:hypothetical protein
MQDQAVTVWTKESVIALLASNDRAVVRAIKGLNARQTEQERAEGTAVVSNGRGFNKTDAPFLGDIARKLPRYNDHMTDKQLYVARLKLRKYWRQLLEMIAENGGQVAFPNASRAAVKDEPVMEAGEELATSGEWTV